MKLWKSWTMNNIEMAHATPKVALILAAGEMVACLKPPSYAKATDVYAGSVKASRYPL